MPNHIPRKFHHMIVESVAPSSVGKKGRKYRVVRDETNGYLMTDLVTGQKWATFASHLRNENFYKVYCIR